MSKNEARRQKQLAKKKAKREEKRTHLARLTSPDPTVRLAGAGAWPVVAALVPTNLWAMGIGSLLFARRLPDGQVACGMFLVDTYCLGVKNALWKIMSPAAYHDLQISNDRRSPLQEATPEHFAKLLNAAVDYAQSLGFAPHPDYRHARMLLSSIDPALCPDTFEFGKDGRPFYVRGPHESLEKARFIGQRIKEAGGEYVVPVEKGELMGELRD